MNTPTNYVSFPESCQLRYEQVSETWTFIIMAALRILKLFGDRTGGFLNSLS
jgi:hypothetical protein